MTCIEWTPYLLMCGSKNYPYLPHRRDFPLDTSSTSGNSSQASYIYLTFWAFEPPARPLPEFPIRSVGGSMDIFWNYTMFT